MFNVGTVCVKIAGRDAGKTCVVVEAEKDGIVLIEGATRRRKCNIRHLERTNDSVKVKKGATHAEVMKALKLEPRTSKPRKAAERPRRVRKAKPKPVKKAPEPEKKAPEKKVAPKKEEPKPPKEKPAKKDLAKKKA